MVTRKTVEKKKRVVNTGKKKYQYTQTNNGKAYSYYRKSLTINGKTRTITASNAKEWGRKE